MKRANRRNRRRRASESPKERLPGGPIPGKSRSRALAIAADLTRTIGASAIEFVPIDAIRPNPRNARRHTIGQIERLAASIVAFGFIGALIIDDANRLLAGHARLKALRRLGYEVVPCIRAGNLTAEAKEAFALADNQLALLATWDDVVLKDILTELTAKDLDFELEATGFDTVELDVRTGSEPDPYGRNTDQDGFSTDPDDRMPEREADAPAVSRPGDLWLAADHRVLCGDALDPLSYDTLALDSERVVQVVTDPPYNVSNNGHVSQRRFREFAMAHGELSRREFADFLVQFLLLAAAVAIDGAIFHICMDWRHMVEILAAAERAGLTLKNLCVWTKPSGGMGSFYKSQHELVFVFKLGTAAHINNFGLGGRGRNRTNIWSYPAVRGARTGVNDPDGGHPTVKPVSMIMDAIRDCSRRGDVVLDPFGGSGTTLIAAERVARRAWLIELDPAYVDLIVRRFQAVTGKTVILAGDGRSFHDIAIARRAGVAPMEVR